MTRRSFKLTAFLVAAFLGLAGCGGSSPQETSGSVAPNSGSAGLGAGSGSTSPRPAPAPNASGTAPEAAAAGAAAGESPALEKSSPEWLIAEMSRLRTEPLTGETPQQEGENAPVDVARVRAAARERNLQIARLAEEAIALTHADPQQELLFDAAVHHLTESRLQLALQGEQADIDALYETADVLKQRDPKSKGAAEAGFALVQYAAANARKFVWQEPKWLEHFARQARLFAGDFPHDEARAIEVLDAAGWSCEVHGLRDEALACYTQMQEQYSQHPDAAHVTAVLRRLQLEGQPLQLRGTTFDGGELRIEDLRGKIVLVVFWAADQNGFDEQLPALQAAAERYSGRGLVLVGVNLDTDERAVEAFLEQNSVTWPTLFFPSQRGWDNPIASYYGIRNVPAFWLVDSQGSVLSTDVDPAELDVVLAPLLASAAEPASGE